MQSPTRELSAKHWYNKNKEGDHKDEGDCEALTSFDKYKQIQTEGKVQEGAPVNLNSKTLKSLIPSSSNRG